MSIYDCFLWPDGDFVFEDDRLPEHISVYIPLELTAIILEGARRSDEWNRIEQVFPSRFTTFTVESDEDAELSEEDRKILELVSQGKNLGEIALELHAVDFYAATRLHELYQRGLISVAVAMEEIPFEQQMADLQDKLRQGVVCFNAGQHSEALSAFEAAPIDPQNKYAALRVEDSAGDGRREGRRRNPARRGSPVERVAERVGQIGARPSRRVRPFSSQRRVERPLYPQDLPDAGRRGSDHFQAPGGKRPH